MYNNHTMYEKFAERINSGLYDGIFDQFNLLSYNGWLPTYDKHKLFELHSSKIFVGGIPAEASKETLTEYFSQFGDVSDCIIMVDNMTGRSRGFGFVTFIDPLAVNRVLGHVRHTICGKVVDAKRAVPKGPNQGSILRAMGITSNRADRNPECKIFVGGVAQGTTESDLETHFKEFGKVLEVKIPKDQNTQRARGFSFVLFESPECVVNATKERFHKVNGKMVEVKLVQLQPNKASSDKASEDGRQLQTPPSSPYMHMNRAGFFQQQQPSYNYIGLTNSAMHSPSGYFEQPYEPPHSASTHPCITDPLGAVPQPGYSGAIPQSGFSTRSVPNENLAYRGYPNGTFHYGGHPNGHYAI